MSHTKRKWVIVFLIYADFRRAQGDFEPFAMNEEMKVELDLMFEEILTTPLNSDNARLFVILNGIKYSVYENQQLRVENKTLIYEIINPHNLRSNTFGSVKVIDNKILRVDQANPDDLQKPEKLKIILKNIKVEKEEEVFLITWDHGSAFGIFREVNPTPPSVIIRNPIDDELEKFPYLREFWEKALDQEGFYDFMKREKMPDPILQVGTRLFTISNEVEKKDKYVGLLLNSSSRGFFEIYQSASDELELKFNTESYLESSLLKDDFFDDEGEFKLLKLDEKVPEILRNDELAVSIESWLAGRKVAVLLMMNCWMMNLHTMYELRNAVASLVAPQGDISIPGYNYRDIFRYIYKPDSYFKSHEKLAIKCVCTCENKFAKKRAKKSFRRLKNENHPKIDSWKIIAIDLQKSDGEQLNLLNQIDLLRKILLVLNSQLESGDLGIKFFLKNMRLVSFDYTHGHSYMVDVINWLSTVYYNDLNNFQNIITKAIFFEYMPNLLDITLRTKNNSNSILAMSRGKRVFGKEHTVVNLQPTGYGIFFPDRIPGDINLIDNFQNDSLLQTALVSWKILLKNLGLIQ